MSSAHVICTTRRCYALLVIERRHPLGVAGLSAANLARGSYECLRSACQNISGRLVTRVTYALLQRGEVALYCILLPSKENVDLYDMVALLHAKVVLYW